MEHAVDSAKHKGRSQGVGFSARRAPAELPPLHPMLQLQRNVGNQAVLSLLRSGAIQAKLAVGSADDPLEHEADRVADQVMRKRSGAAMADGEECEECQKKELVQRSGKTGAAPSDAPSIVHQTLATSGRPLDAPTRTNMETRFGRDFGDVRIHTDPSAAESAGAIDALAYTMGSHIVFGQGQYAPGSEAGGRLLAHELAHVAQRQLGIVQRSPLDPANPAAWDWYGNKEHRDSSFLQTVDQASRDASALGANVKDSTAPTTDEDRAAIKTKINTLIRLKAVAMVGAHRNELLERKARFEAMLAAPANAAQQQGPGASEADRKADTAKAIRSAAQVVINLNTLKGQLEDLRANLAGAVRINSGAVSDQFATLRENASPYPPKDLADRVNATKDEIRGVSLGTRKLKLIDLRDYLVGVRSKQIGGIDGVLITIYDEFPFLADLSAQKIMTGHELGKATRAAIGIAGLLSPILGPFGAALLAQKDQQLDDETLLKEVRASFDRLLERTDEAIVKVGSGGINPLDLPGAVAAARSALPPPLQTELSQMQQDHEVFKFAVDMAFALGIAVLAGATGGLGLLGAAGWAATTGAVAAGAGAVQVARQAKDLLDRQTIAAAATNPRGELLGVSAPSALEKVMVAAGVILTAVDLVGVAQGIRGASPHFAEEPHVSPTEEPHVPPADELPKASEVPTEPRNAPKFVDEHPETITDNTPGRRRAELGDGHEVVEVQDAEGIHCEYHSPGGPGIPCPTVWERRAGEIVEPEEVPTGEEMHGRTGPRTEWYERRLPHEAEARRAEEAGQYFVDKVVGSDRLEFAGTSITERTPAGRAQVSAVTPPWAEHGIEFENAYRLRRSGLVFKPDGVHPEGPGRYRFLDNKMQQSVGAELKEQNIMETINQYVEVQRDLADRGCNGLIILADSPQRLEALQKLVPPEAHKVIEVRLRGTLPW